MFGKENQEAVRKGVQCGYMQQCNKGIKFFKTF